MAVGGTVDRFEHRREKQQEFDTQIDVFVKSFVVENIGFYGNKFAFSRILE